MPVRVKASEFGIASVTDEIIGVTEYVSGDTLVYPASAGIVMGYSWSLYACHDVLIERMVVAEQSRGHSREESEAHVLYDRQKPPLLRKGFPILAPYVYNGNIIAIDPVDGKSSRLALE